jgi:hypothetical protein
LSNWELGEDKECDVVVAAPIVEYSVVQELADHHADAKEPVFTVS